MRIRKIILLFVFSIFIGKISAQEYQYTLDSCISLALQNNVAIKNQLLSIEAAKQTKNEALSKYFPNISAMGFAFKANDDILNARLKLGTVMLPYLNIPIQIPTIPLQILDQGMMGAVTAIQPVFYGLQIVYGNKLAKVGIEANQLQLKLSQNEVSQKVEEYFWQIINLQEKLKTITVIEEQIGNIKKDAETAVEAGVIKPNDLLTIEMKHQELSSGKLKIENGIKICKMLLRQYSGISEREFSISYDTLMPLEQPQNFYINPEDGLANRTEKQLLDRSVKAAQLQTKMEIGKHLPKAAIGASYMGYDMDIAKNNFGVVFGSISVPITDWWGGGHAIKKQKLNEQIAENEKQNALEMMLVQIEQSWNELEEAYNQVLLAKKSILSSTENLRLNQDYYEAGTTKLSDLLEAQTHFQNSQDLYIESFTNYQVKIKEYLNLTGR